MDKPNIIFILTDDQRYDTFGFMGNSYIHTPNLDKMAQEGVYFDEVFHVAPVCMPSRASIQLGEYIREHRCGFDQPTNYTISKKEYETSYPVLLRKHGYFTGFIGKFGFAVTEKKVLDATNQLGYVKKNNEPIYHCIDSWNGREEGMPKDDFDIWNGFTGQGRYRVDEDGTYNGYRNSYAVEHLNEFTECQAKDFLRIAKDSGKPFSLSISFKAPHRPFQPSDKWKNYYKDMDIPRQVNDKPEYFAKLPQVVREHSRNAEEYWGRYSKQLENNRPWKEDRFYKQDIRDYYGLISGVDEAVGNICEELHKLNLDRNTIIIYTSDNGYFFGSKQIGGKELLYEESIRAPLIVYDPTLESQKQKRCIHGLVSIIDVYATILDYAGIRMPALKFGKSIRPLMKEEAEEIRDAVYGENDFNNNYLSMDESEDPNHYQSIRSKYVRTKEYKFIRYHECHPVVEELFSVKMDPLEAHNLMNDPDYKGVADSMRAMLDDFEKFRTEPGNCESGADNIKEVCV